VARDGVRRFLSVKIQEDASIRYRVATAGVVLAAIFAAASQQAVDGSSAIAALVLVPVGFVLSYHRRERRNVVLKIALALGLLVAFGAFLEAVRFSTTIDSARAPLVALFLWVQVLHSFDVPRPRDLTFSVASSVALVALAGSLAFSGGFVWVVLLYACLLLAALVLGHEAQLRTGAETELASEVPRTSSAPRAVWLARPMAGVLVLTLLSTSVVFVFLPRLSGAQIASLPFSFARRTPIPGFIGGVAHPQRQGGGGGTAAGFDPNVYFGYGETVDLHVRGRLSDELVLRVRTPRPSLYRGQAFDVYRNGAWTSSDTKLDEVRGTGVDPIPVPRSVTDAALGPELVQTFYVERPLPNILFHAYRADEVYVSSTTLRVDDFSSMRLPFILEKDTIYSVISHVPDVSAESLRSAPPVNTAHPDMARFLQVPSTLSGRFRTLAQRITRPHSATVDKVSSVERWLRRNKHYRLDIPRDPPGRDPVDVFVFDRDEGFCEQIAATMALMLRASGVPARLVTGFGPGERNLFTGYWEVRNSDAHAWVEVFYPGHGWIPYDPTFGVPVANAANTTFMLAPLKHLAAVFAPIGALRNAIGNVANASPLYAVFFGLVFVLGVVALFRGFAGLWAGRRPEQDRVVRAWLEIEAALRKRGLARASHETVLEFVDRAAPELRDLGERFGRLRYGPDDADPVEWEQRARRTARELAGSRR
jgi:transglutaminase-like putative cysteine protease